MNCAYPFARPLYVMAKPAGAACNLRCQYCYYLEKQQLVNSKSKIQNSIFISPSHGGVRGGLGIQDSKGWGMSDALLERYIRDYISVQQMPDVLFTWHGGEPMLRPLSFYKEVVRLQRYYGRGKRISNSIQTNGTLLTPEWCRFLHDEGWLVGISIDGTREQHDAYRLDVQGRGTWESVMRGIEMLNKYGVEWNAMATANHHNAQDPLSFYRFFRDELGCKFLQVSPVVERLKRHTDGRHLAHLLDEDCPLAPFSIRPDEWGRFATTIFDEWVRRDVGIVFVQLFDATLAGWMGMAPGVCVYAEECGHAAVMEANGDVYSCDHFVFPEYRLGNILTDGLPAMLYGAKQNHFSRLKKEGLPRQCRQCRWLKACHGECPRLRFQRTADGEPGLNYLCAGYQVFFQHVASYMDYMRDELLAGRPASGVMHLFGTPPPHTQLG